MRERAFPQVRERLLRAGVAPRHVNRYVMELRDHLTDLVAREQSAGLDLQAAESKARLLLGTDAQLVQAMIDRGAPRSLAAKVPWAVFGLLPLVALVTAMILLAIGTMAFFAPFRDLSGAAIPGGVRAVGMLVTILGSYGVGLVLAAGCVAIALRQRLSSRWVWVGLALIALACGPLGVHVEFLQPESGMPGGVHGAITQIVLTAGRIDVATTFLVISLRTFVLFALSALAFSVLRQRMERHDYPSAA